MTQNMQIQTERRGLRLLVAAATPTGSTNDTVVVFSPAALPVPTVLGSYPLATFAVVTSSAADGTSVKINRRGRWGVTAHARFTATGAATVVAGISLDASAAQLIADPDPTSPVFIANTSWAAAATGEGGNAAMYGVALVTDTMAGSAALGILRLQLSNGAGAAPAAAAGLVVATVLLQIEYLGDLSG